MRALVLNLVMTVCCVCLLCHPVAARTPWTMSKVTGSPDPPKPFHLNRVYKKLQFNQPVELQPLAETGEMLLLERTGRLYAFRDDPDCDQPRLLMDLKENTKSFKNAYGFAIHPEFESTGWIFIVYALGPVTRPDGSRLSRFTLDHEGSQFSINPESEKILLTWHSGGHNGSTVRFDSKGYLYFSAGDGAKPFPPDEYNVSQDLSDLRSTICRIDVSQASSKEGYRIPDDNPFIDFAGARPEIWAYGFRNPWRFAIDHQTDQLLCGDVGWELWEMVFDVKRGGNYGWSLFEGPQAIRSDLEPGPTSVTSPLVAYSHAVGQSITGGQIYRGGKYPELQGAYLYGDYVTGLIWALRHEENQVTWNPVIAETGLAVISFAETLSGETLVVSYDGQIHELVAKRSGEMKSEFPRKLSQTGIFESATSLRPNPGVVSYQPITTAWSGGMESRFTAAIPGEATIKVAKELRRWVYPDGSVFTKTISDSEMRIETQILHFDGINWQPYTYAWLADQSDAYLVDADGSLPKTLTQQYAADSIDWGFSNRSQCRACHSRQNGGAVGFSFEALSDSALSNLVDLAVLDRMPPKAWGLQKMVDPTDRDQQIELRAKSYLAANCAHCHRRGGGGTVAMDLAYSTPTSESHLINEEPAQGKFNIENARVIAPGAPERSVLLYRMITTGSGHMPKLWSRDNDREGLLLLADWIRGMSDDQSKLNLPLDQKDSSSVALQKCLDFLRDESSDPSNLDWVRNEIKGSSSSVAAIYERLLPKGERQKRMGTEFDPSRILELSGDPTRGKELFFHQESIQCSRCHQVAGTGGSIGPALDGIGARQNQMQLLAQLTDPSQRIDPKYASLQVLTFDGRINTGVILRRNDQELVLGRADGSEAIIRIDDIDSQRLLSTSLMPSGLLEGLTAQQIANLIAYLGSLTSNSK